MKYEVYSGGKKYTGSDIAISADGLLSVRGNAESQTVTVRATSKIARAAYGECEVKIQAVSGLEAMELKQVGFDKLNAPTKLVDVKGDLNYVPDTDLVFIASIYDNNGVLKASFLRELSVDELGSNASLTINFNAKLSAGFDKDSDTIRVYTWTRS